MKRVQCLVLAGGLGTRMQHIGQGIPKALLPIGSKTFIEWQLEWLFLHGVSEVVMALAHESQLIEAQIRRAIARSPGNYPRVNYSYDGERLLGTGGAVRRAANQLDDDFLVTYGDSFLFLNAAELLDTHVKSEKGLTISIFKNAGARDKSNTSVTDGKVFYDKQNPTPAMDHIDYGMLAIKKEVFLKNTPEGQAFDLSSFMNERCRAQDAGYIIAKRIFEEIGSPEGYERLDALLDEYNYDLKALQASAR